jgi:hypothetical protein
MADEEIVTVPNYENCCVVKNLWCIYRNGGESNCQHPSIEPGDWINLKPNICIVPPRIYIHRHDLPKYIALRLIG